MKRKSNGTKKFKSILKFYDLKKVFWIKHNLFLKDSGHHFEYQLWTSALGDCLNM